MALEMFYSVEDYGAVHDGVTDDTVAIQAAIQACFDAGGGIVYFPNGTYIIGGSLVTSVNGINPNCQIYFPLANASHPNLSIVIKLQGESGQFTVTGPLNDRDMSFISSGVILKSTILASGTVPAVLGSSFYTSGLSQNLIGVVVENINIQVRATTTGAAISHGMTAFNFRYLSFAQIKGVCSAYTDQSVWDSLEPTDPCYGFYMPSLSMSADYGGFIEHANAIGFRYGFRFTEHDWAIRAHAVGCTVGHFIERSGEGHALNLNLFSYGCKYSIMFQNYFHGIINLFSEKYTTAGKWYQNLYDILFQSTPTCYGNLNIYVQKNGGPAQYATSTGGFTGNLLIHDIVSGKKYTTPGALGGNGWDVSDTTSDVALFEINKGITSSVVQDKGFGVLAFTHKSQANTNGALASIQVRNLAIAAAEKRSYTMTIVNNGATNSSALVEYLLLSGTFSQVMGVEVNRRKFLNRICVDSDITPTQLTGNTDNWQPTGYANAATIRISSNGAYNLTGLSIGQVDGDEITLINISASNITLMNDVTSTAANRFLMNADFILLPAAACRIFYDGTSSRWRKL